MPLFAPLSIGRAALLAQQRALQVTGQNIANVNTPGYSRQRATLTTIPPAGDLVGGGVRVDFVEQAVDPFLEARRLASASSLAAATTSRDLLDRIQSVFPVQGASVGTALQAFFATANALVTSPQDLAVRADLLAKTAALAAQLRGTAADLATTQRDTDRHIEQTARDANEFLASIASLNANISAAEIGGASANDLRDSRRETLASLAKSLDIHAVEQSDGSVNVFAASGIALVLGSDAATLTTQPGAGGVALDGGAVAQVGIQDAAGSVIPLPGNLGGTLGALVAVRDQTTPAIATDLDTLATTLRDEVNAVQTDAAGRDLDGLVGGALFSGNGAADLAVALTDPRGIAAARSANPGDNVGAQALLALGDATFAALGGATLGDFFGGVQAHAGAVARTADEQVTIQQTVGATLDAQRDAISGVSLEEEFSDLIRFQRGFQAASQLIVVSNHMLDDLFGLIR
jgi:flagellar hook-associated protein 1 FlgK